VASLVRIACRTKVAAGLCLIIFPLTGPPCAHVYPACKPTPASSAHKGLFNSWDPEVMAAKNQSKPFDHFAFQVFPSVLTQT
jgi:hypothetical protein